MARIALALLLVAVSASAQMASDSQNSGACPIHLFAERESAVTLQSARDTATAGSSQSLHVTLSRGETAAIVSVEVTLHGISSDAQVIPAAAHPALDLTKSFHLERKPGEAALGSFHVSMSRAGVLRWIDVTSITYADGSMWQSAQPSVCRAVPSPLLLVAGR